MKLSEVYAYVHLTNTGFVMFILCCDVILLNFYQSRYVLKTITNVAAMVYRILDQLRLF